MQYDGLEIKAIEEVPKGAETKDGLAALGVRVANEITAGRSAVESAKKDLYDRLLSIYLHDAPKPEKPPFKGASASQMNVMQVKGDALGTNVIGTMTAKKPYCIAMAGYDKDRFRRNVVAERCVQFFIDKSHARSRLSETNRDTFLYNVGVLFTRFDGSGTGFDPTPGIDCDALEAFDFVVYPPSVVSDVWDDAAKTCGHRMWVRRSTCDARKKSGHYADIMVSSDLPEAVRGSQEPSVTKHISHDSAGDKKNDLLPLWWVCFKDFDKKGDEVWWWGLMSETDKQFLRLKRHTEPRPPYHVIRYKPNKGEFWSKSTVGNDLQGIQLDVNDLLRLWIDGTKFNVYGVMVGPSYGKAEQAIKYGPGEMALVDGPADVQYFNPKADLQWIPPAIQMLLSYADQIVRISQEFSGGESKDSTATQAAIRQAGMKAGIDDYISVASNGLVSLFEYYHMLLVNNIDAWWDELSIFLGLTDEDKARLEEPVLWMPHTEGIGSTPGAQVQLLQMIMESIATLGAPVDKRGLVMQMFTQAERMGLANATDLILPESPEELIGVLAGMLGVDPLILNDAIQQAMQVSQLAQQGQQNEQRQDIGEDVASGLGIMEGSGTDEGGPRAFGQAVRNTQGTA